MNESKTIYYFNPTCEMAVANGSPFYQASSLLRDFEDALSTIMLCFAGKNDFLIKETAPSPLFIENFKLLDTPIAQISKKEEILMQIHDFKSSVKLSPWGWSPAANYYFKEFEPYCKNIPQTNPEYFRKYYERKNAIPIQQKIVQQLNSNKIISESQIPKVIYSLQEVNPLIAKWGKVVLKAPISSSGRGLQVIRQKRLNISNQRWINNILNQQGYLVCEPLHEKLIDFSFQYQVTNSQQVNYLGISYFKTNTNGQYQGHYLNNKPKQMTLIEKQISPNLLNELAIMIREGLSLTDNHLNKNFIGVDALFYWQDGDIKIYPSIEINPRFNMGILSIFLQKLIHPESKGEFRIYHDNIIDYQVFAKKMAKENPPKLVDGKFSSGFLSLTDSFKKNTFGAYISLNGVQ